MSTDTEKQDTAQEPVRRPRGRGRPTKYTDAMGKAICKMLASGMTLIAVCRRPGMPRESTVRAWLLDLDHPFFASYARARQIGYAHMADEVLLVADDPENGTSHEKVAHARLRVDTRKWLLAKALPKIYGDRPVLEPDSPKMIDVTPADGDDHLAPMFQRFNSGLKLIESKPAPAPKPAPQPAPKAPTNPGTDSKH